MVSGSDFHPATRADDRQARVRSPFALDDDASYRRWRDWKLARAPAGPQALVVEVGDPARLSAAEHAAIVERCRVSNMAVYASRRREPDKEIARRLGEQLGLRSLDANWLADEDGISSLTVSERGTRSEFIPYTDRPIRWHTDGYYNEPRRKINAMLLHCAERAEQGGGNRLLDHEIAYILLRDADPAFVRALSAQDAMLIPPREAVADAETGAVADTPAGSGAGAGEGAGEGEGAGAVAAAGPDADANAGAAGAGEVARRARSGPVFSLLAASGDLHMRYTARTRSIAWHDDPATRAAVEALRAVLDAAAPYVHSLRLEPGMGIVCNNVLHERDAFSDSPEHRRLVFRARYHDRIAGTLSSFTGAWAD
jgi:hypothetical protein